MLAFVDNLLGKKYEKSWNSSKGYQDSNNQTGR